MSPDQIERGLALLARLVSTFEAREAREARKALEAREAREAREAQEALEARKAREELATSAERFATLAARVGAQIAASGSVTMAELRSLTRVGATDLTAVLTSLVRRGGIRQIGVGSNSIYEAAF